MSSIGIMHPPGRVFMSAPTTYNESVAQIDTLVGSLEALGATLSLGFIALQLIGFCFLFLSRDHSRCSMPPSSSYTSTISFVCRCVLATDVWFRRHLSREPGAGCAVQDSTDVDSLLPADHGLRHLAIIMDGNRRYGKKLLSCNTSTPTPCSSFTSTTSSSSKASLLKTMATSPLNGHRAGGEKLMEVIDHCVSIGIEMLTVYAFSTENWNRTQNEIDVLMFLFEHFFQRIRESARRTGIFIRFIATEPQMLPPHILELMKVVELETRLVQPRRIVVNCCVSYGGRSEIVQACRRLVQRCGATNDIVTEQSLHREMLRSITQEDHEAEDAGLLEAFGGADPHVLLRTSGESRTSNFLMYETAYSELVFIDKAWPELDKSDLVGTVREYLRRQRRFGV